MNIEPVKRPWEKKVKQGTRYTPDPRYQSPQWKSTREQHKAGHTEFMEERVSNLFCIQCWKDGKKNVPMHTVDHIVPVKDGADFFDLTNMQSLCKSCHAKKSANEGKKFLK